MENSFYDLDFLLLSSSNFLRYDSIGGGRVKEINVGELGHMCTMEQI